MFVSALGNETLKLTRNVTTNTAESTVKLNHSLSCYHKVIAFDVESDNSTGSLAVPGILFNTGDSQSNKCLSKSKILCFFSMQHLP